MKELKVSYSCQSNCVVATTLRWKKNPVIRSYDLFGIYFRNNSLVSKSSTSLVYSTNKLSPIETINVSYQHSQKIISLVDSRKFSFSSDGFGGVFKFNSSVGEYFDGMRGLVINLN